MGRARVSTCRDLGLSYWEEGAECSAVSWLFFLSRLKTLIETDAICYGVG